MVKSEFISVVAQKLDVSNKKAAETVDAVIEAIMEAKDGVAFKGFGTFKVVDKPEKICRNPQTGEMITVPAKKAVSFKVGSAYKAAVNE